MRFITLVFLLTCPSLFSQTNVTFRGAYTFTNNELANLWGYANGSTEYALVGNQTGMSIINVTDPANPTFVVHIPGPTSDWREVKTYGNYAYVVTEGTSGTNVGLTIVNLSFLPNINVNNTAHVHTYRGDGAINNLFNKAHALQVDESTGYLYLYGSNLNSGRPLILNLNPNPYNPTYAGYVNTAFTGSNANYVHDGYAEGNMLYAGHIYGGFFSIVNTTNKSNPTIVATQSTPNLFTHNTWLNGNTLFTTDETSNSYLAAYDISNTDNIRLLDKIQSNPGSSSIVHNTYILNNYAITSWYKDGFTIVDVSRPDNLVQVGNYDTYPGGSGNGFFGCWGVYPYLPSGNIIASNINDVPSSTNGKLFVLTPTYTRGCYLEGIITDASNSNPLNGASIQITTAPSVSETSNSSGVYKMGRLNSGTVSVSVSKTNYITYTTNVNLSNGVLRTLNVALQPLALPVELIDFQASAVKTDALLKWSTASERDHAGFDIQHSTDGFSWQTEGFVPARNDGIFPAIYSFEVKNLTNGIHFFRLRQIDEDGRSSLSGIENVRIGQTDISAVISPTLARERCDLRIQTPGSGKVQVDVFYADGRPTNLHWTQETSGDTVLSIPAQDLPAGTYFVRVEMAGESVTTTFTRM
ncbi:MAG: choice-of-anchor B family protein [Bacteroidetes bacterium]|nr:choice-of-anchor B family protein [Bacteroidota bacterium]